MIDRWAFAETVGIAVVVYLLGAPGWIAFLTWYVLLQWFGRPR